MRDLLIRAALLIAALAGTSQAVLGGCPPGMRHVGFGICIQQCNGNAVCLGPGAMSDSPAVDRPEPSLCPPGVRQVRCARDPCEVVRCPAHPDAQCLANYCGGCNAVFYDNDGNRVDCDQVTTTQPPTRPPGCEYQGQFYPPGSTIHETHGCMGHGVRCEEGGQILIWDNFRYGCCEHNGQYYEEGATITEGGVTCHCELSHTGEPASMICPSPPTCPPDVEVVNCFANPCDVTSCPAHPDATCRSNYCGGCYAEFFDEEGNEVDCDETDHSPCPPGVAMARCKRDPCEMRTCPGHPNATCQANYCGGCNAEFFDEDGNEVACGEAAVVERPDICPTPTLRDDQCLLGVFKNCSIDTDCRRREKCCFNGCQKTCVHVRRRRPLPERPGTCPAPSLSDADCSGPRLYRVCTTDLDCRRGEKCCDLGCGQECVGVRGRETSPDGPFPERPGTCPAPSLSDADCSGPRLYRVCTTDLDCRRGEKCCDLGCGHECVAVRGRETSPDRPKPGTCPPPLSNDECLLPRPYITCTMEGGGCQRGYVCCDNGCGGALECKRPVRGPMKSKPGTCPASEREAPCRKGEWSQCQGDPDCPQRQKCCSDGCVMICQNPDTTNEPVTKCQDQLQNTQPMPGQFVKQCEEDGSFSTQQCHGSTGFCYCAHPRDGTIYRETGRRGEMEHDCETFWQTKLCGENSHFDTCGHGDCQPTCENPAPICTQVCIAGCQCDDGFALHDGTCIPMSQCESGEDDSVCGENSHFDTCGHGDCQPTCENPAPICTQVCIAGCQCDDGFALHGGTCIPMSQCESGEDDFVFPERPGTCPALSLSDADCSGPRLYRVCTTDLDCRTAEKCCDLGCGQECVEVRRREPSPDRPFRERPGTCPAPSLSDADCSGPRLYRVCTMDIDCHRREKCCNNACGVKECIRLNRSRRPMRHKPGTCPAPSPLLSRDCTRGRRNQCEGDLECPLRQKCCMDGCVKVCQNPIPRIVPGRRPPVSSGRTDAETTTEPDSNGVAVAFRQHDIVPDVIDTAPTVAAEVTYGVADDGVISVDFGNELTPTQVKSPPQVTWPVDDGSLYTLVMTDPDAPSRANPRFREFHHWLVGNIPGNDIQNGETLSQYIGSAPPRRRGLHRYVFLVYEQPGRLEFEERRLGNSSMAHRSRFRTREFASKYNLGDPVAGNFYQAQWDDWVPSLYAAMRQ
ncbi:PEBP1 [Branchiostoma lanceolatum]|uniref:PEBP1 protein n=1 Tax=Branchiostoma lanceolatum TaxID=7740 RepID=A0A8K0EXZ9_BRALA|nr:PEBP1 [Branchiostoma lanceolatum]